MSFQSNIFDSNSVDLGAGNYLHFINIPNLDAKIVAFIDANIVTICEGATGADLSIIKKRLMTFLTPKKGSSIEMGAIAEFFGHLFLTDIGFKQEFLFLNLEEGSIKKGFDGYYSFGEDTWIYESKSGSIGTRGVSHQSKISSAYKDLEDKVSGNPANNPWQNAYNHASNIDVGTDKSLREELRSLSRDFTQGLRQDMRSFNIIPGSTLFLGGVWSRIDAGALEPLLKKLVKTLNFSKIQIVCVNKVSVDQFWEYLRS